MRSSNASCPQRSPRLAGTRGLPLLILLILGFIVPGGAAAGGSEAPFEAANKLYEEGRFPEAATSYRTLSSTGGVSAPLYFNLGNACFKAGQLGQAIAAYRKANRLSPRDPDITANLQFARNQRQGPSANLSTFERGLGRFSLNEWTTFTALALWVWLLLLALIQFRPALKKPLRGTILLLSAATMTLGILLFADWKLERQSEVVVVIAPQASVRHGPLEESQVAFTVNDGAELRLLDRKGDWLQVATGPNRVGWIKRESAAVE